MAKSDRDQALPSATEALEDEEAAQKRAEHAERGHRDVLARFSADKPGSPSEVKDEIPAEDRPGQNLLLKARAADKRPVVEDDAEALKKVQDPWNEREPHPVPTVLTTDSYGNKVRMPV